MFSNHTAYVSRVRRTYGGSEYFTHVICCCPGDWPEIKLQLDEPEHWSTVRFGVALFAIGPPSGRAIDEFADFFNRSRDADRARARPVTR